MTYSTTKVCMVFGIQSPSMPIIGIIVTALLVFSCNSQSKDKFFNDFCQDFKGSNIDSSIGSLTRSTIEVYRYLNLRSLINPSDTFFLRVRYETDTSKKILEYSYYKTKELCKVYEIMFDKDPQMPMMIFDKSKDNINKYARVYNISKNDASFINQLKKNDILKLRDFRSIPNYPTEDYFESILIEYSYKCGYNIISTSNADRHINESSEAKNVVEFMEFLHQKFNF